MLQFVSPIFSRIVVILLLLLASQLSHAQEEANTRYLIQTRDGNVYKGVIVEKQASYIVFQTDNIGQITIQFVDVQQIQLLDGAKSAPVTRPASGNNISTSAAPREAFADEEPYEAAFYLIKPSAFTHAKGEGYYQNVWLFLNQVQYNFTDNVSVGFGLIPLDLEGVPAWIQPKLTLPLKKDLVNFSIGALNGVTMGINQNNFGAVYSEIGFGNAGTNLSIGMGKYYERGEFGDGLLFSFSGMLQLGRSTVLVTENYLAPDIQFYTGGMHQRLGTVTLQVGIVGFSEDGWFAAIPTLGLSIPFNVK